MTLPRTESARVLRRSLAALVLLLVPVVLVLSNGPQPLPEPSVEAGGPDWPMSRHDPQRTGGTEHSLPAPLHLHWSRDLPPLTPAWPDQPKMPFDAAYDPIVVDDTLFLASPQTDTITAYAIADGSERWTFTGDGPFRFAPLWWDDKLYAACDDGSLYCLNAADGRLLWKFRGGPSDRKVIGNGRLISTWPARGAPVIADGVVYFTASIWPFMGLFIHALDAQTGAVVWSNSGDGSIYIKQPHNSDSFAGVAPQGHLVVTGDKLLLPGGRSVPACYDRKTGKLLHYRLAENGKKGGGSEVAVTGSLFLNGGTVFSIKTGQSLGSVGDFNVPDGEVMYSYVSGKIQVLEMSKPPAAAEGSGLLAKIKSWSPTVRGSVSLPGTLSLLRAGSRLYAGQPGQVVALPLPLRDGPTPIVWKAVVDGKPVRLIAARERLFVVTLEGRLHCFGPGEIAPTVHASARAPKSLAADEWTARAKSILAETKAGDGYCITWGVGSGRLIRELISQSRLHVIVIDPDAQRVARFRTEMLQAGLYGTRVSALCGDSRTVELPPYLATLMVAEDFADTGLSLDGDALPRMFQSLRPYGGAAWLPVAGEAHSDLKARAEQLAGAQVREVSERAALLVRAGALSGSSNWTHEHGDAANTRVSRDQLVKAPLGLLWFGGPSHDGILPRHGHGPQPQVIDGRILIEGMDLLRAIDCYTGRLLWETKLPNVGKIYNKTSHQPGANATGGNFVSTADGIYVAHGAVCVRLDPETGRKMSEFPLPPGGGKDDTWGYVNVVGDYLIGGSDPPPDENAGKSFLSLFQDDELSSSRRLVVLDRHSGKPLWSAAAHLGFRHNGICAGGGKLFTIDCLAGTQLSKLKKGEKSAAPRLVVFDLATGKELWTTQKDVFGTWLSYSEKHDVLLEAGRVARDTLKDEPKGMRAYRASDSKVLWFEKDYTGPAMIHGDMVLQGQGACDILTGKTKLRTDPLTGEELPWVWSRNYGCNTPAASEHLLTFRSGAAGYFDLCRDGGTGNMGGFRSSCTNNLIVACGVLSAPDYTRTCVCSYQNQTSLALVPMPDAEMWTFTTTKESKAATKQLGLNLGAPGDRRSEDGTLWLEYPSVGGTSPVVKVTTTPAAPEWFRRHAALVEGELAWVAASGARGLTSLTVTLDEKAKAERSYTVRLHFVEPEAKQAGERVFAVALQGRAVLPELDVAREAGGPAKALVKEFRGIKAGRELTVTLRPIRGGETVLSGVELKAEE